MSHLTPKENEKLISLVGRRCTVTGKINGKTVDVLWDTGAQVSIVSAKFLKENFPNRNIKDASELSNCDLTKWVDLNFQVGESEYALPVPFLVTNENVELPLVGFNVIEHLIKTNKLNCGVISSNFVGVQHMAFHAIEYIIVLFLFILRLLGSGHIWDSYCVRFLCGNSRE